MSSLLKKTAKFALILAGLYALLVLSVVSFVVALFVPVHLIGRTNRPKGVRLLFRALRILRPLSRFNFKRKSQPSLDFYEVAALLGKGASWPAVKPIIQRSNEQGNYRDLSAAAFSFYIVEERYEDAYEAAEQWCKNITAVLAPRQDEMQRFFREEGTDSIARTHALVLEWKRENDEWEANPQGQPQPQLEIKHRSAGDILSTMPFLSYYSAHLALEIMRWMGTLDTRQRDHAQSIIRTRSTRSFAWMPSLTIDEGLARSLGMDETTLSQVRQRIISSEIS